MSLPLRCRSALLTTLVLIASGCATGSTEDVAEIEPPAPCGVHAALEGRQPGDLRDKPPACALPTPEEVASSCAIRDLVTSPDYRPPTYDEEGFPIDAPPIPDYRVSNLSCRFSTRQRNEAICRFQLESPRSGEEATDVVANFEHRFWQDHGPTHHQYGTRWLPTARCAALDR